MTTGEFYSMAVENNKFDDIIAMVNPRETIDSNGHYGYSFAAATAYQSILRYFKIKVWSV